VNTADHHGATLLLIAARHHDAPLTRVLLAHGADPNLATDQGATPLQYWMDPLDRRRVPAMSSNLLANVFSPVSRSWVEVFVDLLKGRTCAT
jgi:ankyrin repeat protein